MRTTYIITEFILPIKPEPLPRARVAVRGRYPTTYYPKEIERKFIIYKNALENAFNGLLPLDQANILELVKKPPTSLKIALSVVFHYPLPKGTSKKAQEQLNGQGHNKQPDLDNLLKMLLDRMSGIFYSDDRVIYSIKGVKLHTILDPFISVKIKYEWE